MHSIVAAVKAPRTHNRRRVTGSSGRRREGRESERQRPNMSRHLFDSAVLLLLLIVMMCCGSEGAHAVQSNQRNTIIPFKGTTSLSFAKWKEFKEDGSGFTPLRVPSLVEVGDDVFVVAGAQCNEKNGAGGCAGIASKHLDVRGDSMDISTSDINLFCMQLVDTAANNFGKTEVLRPTTLVIGDSVYVLLGSYSHTKQQVQGKNERGLLFVKGTLSEEDGKKKIRWNGTHVVNPQGKGDSHSLTELLGGGGTGAVMRDGSLVFPMQAKKADGKSVLLSMHLPKSGNNWELSSTTPGEGCRDPTLVKWEEDKDDERLSMMAHCAAGYYDVYRSTEDGANWYPSGQPITRVWGNSHNRTGYGVQSGSTTAIIEGKEVMLITAPVYPKQENKGVKGRLHLWVTDNARVYDVGPVSREEDDAAASSLLMKGKDNKELLLLYENKKKDGSYSLVAVRLDDKMERIKEVVEKWKDLDVDLRTCSYPAVADSVAAKGMCIGPVPTEGLVGFLSGNSTQTEWRDEYLGVNATVTNGERRVPNGWTFKGPKAGAEWPVGDMGQTVPYYFANSKFTLVATVSIHEVPKKSSRPVPLIGVRMNDTDSTVLFGLSYTHDKKWLAISENSGNAEHSGDEWKPNETYQVVLQMTVDEWTVLVDGDVIHQMVYDDHLFDSYRISHFYVGGDSKDQNATGGHVTVTNVMLYNEKLSEDDMDKLKESKVTIPSLGVEKNPTEPAASADASVASTSKREEDIAIHANLTDDVTDKQEEENVQNRVPAENPSTVVAESFVSEPAKAAESAGTSRPEGGAQPSEVETAKQTTLNEDNGSMGQDSEVQLQEVKSTESTEVTDIEGSSEGNGAQPPEEEGGTKDRSDGSVSSVAVSSDMGTAATPVDGELQAQQRTEPSGENNDVRSTGTGTAGAEEGLSLEAGDRNSERTMNSDSSLTLPKSDAEPKSAEDTDVISRNGGAEVSSEDGEEVPQTVETTPDTTNTTPGDTKIPSESNATSTPLDTDTSLEQGQFSDVAAMALMGDSTVHGCVSRVFLRLLLGLCVFAFLC
ncbi:trans-sialidase, putative [Trypanosoma cruzi marinkellei]|uniref:Trans-sialidase, putative n=1 Tax=Trypanosoma cruzi marinkellei TaxID=85056 RepID=K2MGB7_TRYCR|nr:trans-sialidase, putative [Trypanosoma cruzi marinkellei]